MYILIQQNKGKKMREKINEILKNESRLLTENYLDVQEILNEEFGNKAVAIIEIGSFFEIYETDNVGVASNVSKELNIMLTRKNKNKPEVTESNPRLCGIPSVSLDKYLAKLIEDDWTVALITQRESSNGFYREVDEIITPGTNVDFLKDEDEHYLASIIIEKHKSGQMSVALTLLEPTLGVIKTFEGHGEKNDETKAFDELIQILNKENIREILCYSNEEYAELNYFGPTPIYKKIKKSKIAYQNQLFKATFGLSHEFLTPIEVLDLELEPYASQSLTNLLQYSISNNKLLVKSLTASKIESHRFMYLGNNPMTQLDVLNKSLPKDLVKIVNKGVSAIGRRFITNQILNPLIRVSEISYRMSLSEDMLKLPNGLITKFRTKLKNVYDMERIYRRYEVGKIEPFEVLNLYKSIESINQITIDIRGFSEKSLNANFASEMSENFSEILSKFDSELLLDKMESVTWNNWSANFVTNYNGPELSELLNLQVKLSEFESVAKDFGGKLKYSQNEGYFIELSNNNKNQQEFKEYRVKKLKNSVKFYHNELTRISEKMGLITEKIKINNKDSLTTILDSISKEEVLSVINSLCAIEFSLNNIYLKNELNFCKPKFIESDENHYDAIDLRHPIVESIDRESFIPNDVFFGRFNSEHRDNPLNLSDKSHKGYVLFGQNSSGKTVLSKSIGISIILAQAGLMTPAKSLELSVFDSLFTRIVGSDDLSRGQSTFAMEMTELKNILKRGTKRSMVIGDEISHGTETTSGLSIVASTILSLKGSFILSTHLHELDKIDDISQLDSVRMVHLSLNYSSTDDKVIYNRKLQCGKGGSTYGLEFAKSIHLPSEFIDLAYKIRNKVELNISGLEELAKEKASRYNPEMFYGVCERCGGKAEEIHHDKKHQAEARAGKYTLSEVNHKRNLVNLCQSCHKKEHMH